MTRQKVTEAVAKHMTSHVPQWVLIMLVTIAVAVIGGIWAHAMDTYASKDAVAANQREIKIIRQDVRGVRQDIKDFRVEQRQDLREIKNLLLPEPPR